jgi:uncharacterized protein (DUF2235 family)
MASRQPPSVPHRRANGHYLFSSASDSHGRRAVGKRLVLCCDGTWNTPDQTRDGKPCRTNVTKVARAVAAADPDGIGQAVFYQRGVGTSRSERVRGGAFGMGLSRGVQDVYSFVVKNYEPGDEIFLFGFSRGAYMARSTVGLIRNAGILRRENADKIEQAYALYRERAVLPRDVESELFRRSYSHGDERIRFIGVWDTVGALGIPWSGIRAVDRLNRRWSFHDTRLSTIVDAAYHALAIDEARKPFAPAVWQQSPDAGDQVLEQVWFSGVHSDVGGGYVDTGLSDIALRWMADRARSYGLAFHDGAFAPTPGSSAADAMAFSPNAMGTLHDSRKGFYRLVPPAPRALGSEPGGHELLASSAVDRMNGDPSYSPDNLRRFIAQAHDVVGV